jgi:hypothetical protein
MARAKGKSTASRQAEIARLFDAKTQRKQERELANYILDLDERSQARADYAERILQANDDSVREMVEWIADNLRKMEGEPQIVFNGQTYNAVKGETELLEKIQYRNFTWVAVRVLVACAEWDIRIGEFNLPDDHCARCGVAVGRARTRKK